MANGGRVPVGGGESRRPPHPQSRRAHTGATAAARLEIAGDTPAPRRRPQSLAAARSLHPPLPSRKRPSSPSASAAEERTPTHSRGKGGPTRWNGTCPMRSPCRAELHTVLPRIAPTASHETNLQRIPPQQPPIPSSAWHRYPHATHGGRRVGNARDLGPLLEPAQGLRVGYARLWENATSSPTKALRGRTRCTPGTGYRGKI